MNRIVTCLLASLLTISPVIADDEGLKTLFNGTGDPVNMAQFTGQTSPRSVPASGAALSTTDEPVENLDDPCDGPHGGAWCDGEPEPDWYEDMILTPESYTDLDTGVLMVMDPETGLYSPA